jgi:hypothetical protein
MNDAAEPNPYEISRREAAELYLRRRRRALIGGVVAAVCVTAAVGVVYSPFNTLAVRAILGIGGLLAMGFGIICASHAYGAWGMRRAYEAAISTPPPAELTAERRRAGWRALASGGVICLASCLMSFADEHRWLGPFTAVLLLGGCASALHHLQVWAVTRDVGNLGKGPGR